MSVDPGGSSRVAQTGDLVLWVMSVVAECSL
jgi:hypothetical protein